MEPSKFDELTKALATATSRRQALKAIGAALGGALGFSRIGVAFAKCHPAGHNCEENSTCCSQLCCIATGQREGVCCDVGQICSNGTCVTPTTTTTAAPPTTTTSTTALPPQFKPSCVCNNGATFTDGCTDLLICQVSNAPAFCSATCKLHGGVSSATCVPC